MKRALVGAIGGVAVLGLAGVLFVGRPGSPAGVPFVGRPGSLAVVAPSDVPGPFALQLSQQADGTEVASGSADGGESVDFSDLEPGEYELAIRNDANPERPSALACDPTSAAGDLDAESGTAKVSIGSGEDVTCTFDTTESGNVLVEHVTRPAAPKQAFSFSPSWGESFQLSGNGSYSSPGLVPGSHSVEPSLPPGWVLRSSSCSDGSTPDAIELGPGEAVSCTFTMARKGRIILRQDTQPSTQAEAFDYAPSWGKERTLRDGESHRSRPLVPGTYSVGHSTPRGWVLRSSSCSDGSPPDAIKLGPGETVTCTFTEAKKGRVVVNHLTEVAGANPGVAVPSDFGYQPSWGPAFRLGHEESKGSKLLAPGKHSLAADLPAGWVLTASACKDGSTPEAISLAPGETVTCAFTAAPEHFTVATFNVLGNFHTEPGGHSPAMASGTARMRWQVDLLQSRGVDVVGLQELQRPQYREFLRRAGEDFDIYPGPEIKQRNKQNAVAWRTSVFELVEGRPVMVPYFRGKLVPMPLVKLRHKATDREVYVMSVHNAASLKRLGNQSKWRDAAMKQQIELAHEMVGTGVPFILTGDMNDREKYFCRYTASGRMHAAAGGSNTGTCTPPPRSIARIDWIFGSKDVAFSDYEFLNGQPVRRTSDHPLIVTEAALR